MKREREEIDHNHNEKKDNNRCQSERVTKLVKLDESGCEIKTEKKTDGNWLSHIMIRTSELYLHLLFWLCIKYFIFCWYRTNKVIETNDIVMFSLLYWSFSNQNFWYLAERRSSYLSISTIQPSLFPYKTFSFPNAKYLYSNWS